MLKQFSFLTGCCLITLLAVLTSCGVFENEEFEILPVVDCPRLALNVQDSCVIASGAVGTVSANCQCVTDTTSTFSCPDLQADVNDLCVTTAGTRGRVDTLCSCTELVRDSVDCPTLMADFRDTCTTALGTQGRIDSTCLCL